MFLILCLFALTCVAISLEVISLRQPAAPLYSYHPASYSKADLPKLSLFYKNLFEYYIHTRLELKGYSFSSFLKECFIPSGESIISVITRAPQVAAFKCRHLEIMQPQEALMSIRYHDESMASNIRFHEYSMLLTRAAYGRVSIEVGSKIEFFCFGGHIENVPRPFSIKGDDIVTRNVYGIAPESEFLIRHKIITFCKTKIERFCLKTTQAIRYHPFLYRNRIEDWVKLWMDVMEHFHVNVNSTAGFLSEEFKVFVRKHFLPGFDCIVRRSYRHKAILEPKMYPEALKFRLQNSNFKGLTLAFAVPTSQNELQNFNVSSLDSASTVYELYHDFSGNPMLPIQPEHVVRLQSDAFIFKPFDIPRLIMYNLLRIPFCGDLNHVLRNQELYVDQELETYEIKALHPGTISAIIANPFSIQRRENILFFVKKEEGSIIGITMPFNNYAVLDIQVQEGQIIRKEQTLGRVLASKPENGLSNKAKVMPSSFDPKLPIL